MDATQQPLRSFRLTDPRQIRIYQQLSRLGAGPAAFYHDACRILNAQPEFDSTSHLVAHLLREIESALRDVLQTHIAEQALTQHTTAGDSRHRTKIRDLLTDLQLPEMNPLAQVILQLLERNDFTVDPQRVAKIRRTFTELGISDSSPMAQVSFRLLGLVDLFVKDSHKTQIRRILQELAIPETAPEAQAWLKLSGKLHAYAHRSNLNKPRTVDDTFDHIWHDMEAILAAVLERSEYQYLRYFRLLDVLLNKQTPSDEDIKVLKQRVPNSLAALAYFFDRLDNPMWLPLLNNGGFFQRPPDPDYDYEQGTVSFPIWPASRYLARMSSTQPEQVVAIVHKIPHTANIRVYIDFVDAALNMSAHNAALLVPTVKRGLELPYQLLFSLKAGELITHLARGGETENALEITSTLLAILPTTYVQNATQGEGSILARRDVRTRLGSWDYEQVLKRHIPDLLVATGVAALTLLCNLLDAALHQWMDEQANGEREDFSYIWRRVVEQQRRDITDDIRNLLVSAIRDGATHLVQETQASVPDLVELLEARRWPIFQRLALHLLATFPERAPELVVQRLTERQRFDDIRVRNEYARLAHTYFGKLPPQDQEKILNWIEHGPLPEVLEIISQRYQETQKRLPTECELAQFVQQWQRESLAALGPDLPEVWQQRLAAWTAELGPLDTAEFLRSTPIAPLLSSPKTVSELGEMSIEELHTYLSTWTSEGDLFAPSPSGLAASLTTLVASEPSRFAPEALRFKSLDPIYVDAVLAGFREAVNQDKFFAWGTVLELCRWVVNSTSDIPESVEQKSPYDRSYPCISIAYLLDKGFEAGLTVIPFELRSVVWEILEPLTLVVGAQQRHGADSLRVQAMEDVVGYAQWVQRHIASQAMPSEENPASFVRMPEVREVLSLHLDPTVDSSLEIRKLYGRVLPWLLQQDQHWTTENISRIFPTDETSRILREAAWHEYMIFCDPGWRMFPLVRRQYELAIEAIDSATDKAHRLSNPDKQLVEHLLTLYWSGTLSIEDELFTRFYEKAPPTLRGYVIEFVGQSLNSAKEQVPAIILQRLEELLIWRLSMVRNVNASDAASEFERFGWWFASKQLTDESAIEHLQAVLELTRVIEPDHFVVQRLAVLASTFPHEVVSCLKIMVEADRNGWNIPVWDEELRIVITTALAAGEQKSRETATQLINLLAAFGHIEFRHLME